MTDGEKQAYRDIMGAPDLEALKVTVEFRGESFQSSVHVVRTGERHFDGQCLAVIGQVAQKAAAQLDRILLASERASQ
jgi:hypothetical protein